MITEETLLQQSYRRLEEKAKGLESHAEQIKRVIRSIKAQRRYSDNDRRLISNNERVGFRLEYPDDLSVIRDPRYKGVSIGMNLCSHDSDWKRENILRRFAETGDELSQKIVNYIDRQGRLDRFWFSDVNEQLIQDLVLRKMKKEEYDEYLLRQKPIGILNYPKKKKIYLPF